MSKAHKRDEYSARYFACGACPKCGMTYTVRAIWAKVFGDRPVIKSRWYRHEPSNIHTTGGNWVQWRCYCDPKLFHRGYGKIPVGARRRTYGCGHEGPSYNWGRR